MFRVIGVAEELGGLGCERNMLNLTWNLQHVENDGGANLKRLIGRSIPGHSSLAKHNHIFETGALGEIRKNANSPTLYVVSTIHNYAVHRGAEASSFEAGAWQCDASAYLSPSYFSCGLC